MVTPYTTLTGCSIVMSALTAGSNELIDQRDLANFFKKRKKRKFWVFEMTRKQSHFSWAAGGIIGQRDRLQKSYVCWILISVFFILSSLLLHCTYLH